MKLKERGYLPQDKHVLSATVSERAGRWFVSFKLEEEIPIPENHGEVVGVDLGIENLATISDGTIIQNPRALKRNKRKLKRIQREVSRKEKGSENRKKAVRKLAKQHARIANIRKDAIHKATTMLAKTKSVIGVETLNIEGMLKNHYLAEAISDASMSEFLRQLEYKAKWYGARIVKADRFYPSSKRCSCCGHIKEIISLLERIYHCDACGYTASRDFNAARNLREVAVSSTET